MYSQVNTFGLTGVESFPVLVEADVSDGMPSFSMVGYLGSALKEAHERVRTAIKNSGFRIPPKRITINLSPAGVRKDGTSLDLAIAIAILSCLDEELKRKLSDDSAFIGELGLDGMIKPVAGILSMIFCAKEIGIKRIFLPQDNLKEASLIDGLELVPLHSLEQLLFALNHPEDIHIYVSEKKELITGFYDSEDDFSDITGLQTVKKACECAAAGRHNILFIGPAGTGKTMAARRIQGILPPMDFEECIETTRIYSIAGLLKEETSFINSRPFRSPHQTITSISMAGGGKYPQPGEISLATNGCLFLDELAEFNPNIIDLLRQPMEEGEITVSRLNGSVTFPAKIMLIAAMNPCKCGLFPSSLCTCTEPMRRKYLGRISGPFRDRIDIGIEVPLQTGAFQKSDSTKDMRKRILIAREIQRERYKNRRIRFNSEMKKYEIDEFCNLTKSQNELLDRICKKNQMSYRSRNKLLKVARTLADLEESKDIGTEHLHEASGFRSYESHYWGSRIY